MTNNLRDVLAAAIEKCGGSMTDYTVLSGQNDPFRVDTPAGHRDGEWLATAVGELTGGRIIHLRGLHYILVTNEVIKPDGKPYTNTEKDWTWLQEKASKAARYLQLVPFEQIKDQRNEAPVVRLWEPMDPEAWLSIGLDLAIPAVDELLPRIAVDHFVGEQPYKIVLVGEKSSLRDVLAPVAEARQADLYLPTGEISDTQTYQMARIGAEDGRPMVVLYFSDCDPSGFQMPISVGRKLQAFKEGFFPDLDFEVRPVALTVEQVEEYGLPSTPLKDTEKRADRWTAAMGVAQTEIDALAALQPDLLRRIAREATNDYFDPSLERRVREARSQWLAEAQVALEEQLGADRLAEIHRVAGERLAELTETVNALRDQFRFDVDDFTLPAMVVPDYELDWGGIPDPLIDSRWGFAEGSRALKAAKSYEGDQ